MEAKHTPGPWTVIEEMAIGGHRIIAEGSHRAVAITIQRDPHPVHGDGISIAQSLTNGHLVAAAPDLLGALRDLLADTQHKHHECGDVENCPVLKAHAAIAKATQEHA